MVERQARGRGRWVTVLVLVVLALVALAQWGHGSNDGVEEAGIAAPSPVLTTTTHRPPTTTAAPAADPDTDGPLWQVVRIVDGDTIHVERDGVVEKVRLIGIDSPERGECGFTPAVDSLRRVIGDSAVTLASGAATNQDQYGRLLRYVLAGNTDVGLAQIKSGYAVARFDSRDGYGAHAREAAYIEADRQSPDQGWLCATPAPVKPQSSWPLPGDQHPCPQGQPVKGNEPSMIAHSPGQQSYLETNPEQCFASVSDAVAAGFRPAKR